MQRKNFNDNWTFYSGSCTMLEQLQGAETGGTPVTLPHDAMIHEPRTSNTKNTSQTGFCPGGNYEYRKTFDVPADWVDKTAILEFEGVYQTAMVYVNDALAAANLYGYKNFYVPLDDWLHYGQVNTIRVLAGNGDEQNSRWYSGSGIYREVHLLLGRRIHITTDGLRILSCDVSAESAVVEVTANVKSITRRKEKVEILLEIIRNGSTVCQMKTAATIFANSEEKIRQRVCLEHPALWNCDVPNLYTCRVTVCSGTEVLDCIEETFGIRKFELDAVHGLRINGQSVKLRGTCLHHDNGILGAATFARAEQRRCEQLKTAGFNSVRSAHQPMSKSMLRACDQLGLLVMDELTDMWTNHKNPNDFALHFEREWQSIADAMIAKDYNHPCVIFYSIGNEIQEMGTEKGVLLNRHLSNYFHAKDPSRYVTNGIHGMITASGRMTEILPELLPLMQAQPASEPDADREHSDAGSNGLNRFTSLLVGEVGNAFACHPAVTEALQECMQPLDVMGYNYFAGRHAFEKTVNPHKPVLGSETFPADMVRIWHDVKRNTHVLGDFTWIGYDYLGEAGAGVFYYDGNQNFGEHWPDRTSYLGDIDIIGYRRPISYLREIVFGLREDPYIAVERVNRHGQKHSQTPWMLKDNIASWTWPGYEGMPANVDVYADADEVELLCNGISLGRKPTSEACQFTASYTLPYTPGELLAVSYRGGKRCGQCTLRTAGSDVRLSVETDRTKLRANGQDLAFLTFRLIDENGVENLNEKRNVRLQIAGAGTLQGFGNADPQSLGAFDSACWPTYDGYLLAVIRAGTEPGAITITAEMDSCAPITIILHTQKEFL